MQLWLVSDHCYFKFKCCTIQVLQMTEFSTVRLRNRLRSTPVSWDIFVLYPWLCIEVHGSIFTLNTRELNNNCCSKSWDGHSFQNGFWKSFSYLSKRCIRCRNRWTEKSMTVFPDLFVETNLFVKFTKSPQQPVMGDGQTATWKQLHCSMQCFCTEQLILLWRFCCSL